MARQRWIALASVLAAMLALGTVGQADEIAKELLGRRLNVTVDADQPGRPIVGIDLSHCRIQDHELAALKQLPGLRQLNLSWNQFLTDAGLKELRELKRLQTLDLSATRITDAGLKELKGRPRLQAVYLRNTEVTEAGIEELQAARPELRIRR